MHLTRPKSSKGRSRPAPSKPLYAGHPDGIRRPPVSPQSPGDCRPDRNVLSQSQPLMWQSGQLSGDEVLRMLQHTPAAPPPSLNKYKVLPSIERRQSLGRQSLGSPGRSLDRNMSKLNLSEEDATLQQQQGQRDPGAAGDGGTLLLAVRAPCGRRFQQPFEPTDTLSMVRTSAEVRFGARYEEASIETMDVPRRSFTDMNMTLAQCGILNKSVLCISQSNHSVTEHERA
ncbi:UBX domain-containing protein 10 [Anabas testudineus]|uniref:UBX domain-containing protein n=1 Tax=Anabas testudineus TaxID=64144 RepID=A0A3Q1JQ41_ANATE|nr:UBX domain-containing protein 10 [Anabas testudineus]XP_026224303.1 UBX domain-containing protein 10 [Anabas testudineus]